MPPTKIDLQKAFKTQEKKFDQKLKNLRKAITRDVGSLIDERILPQIDSLSDSVEGVSRKIDAIFDRTDRHSEQLTNHKKRIIKLEKTSPATL